MPAKSAAAVTFAPQPAAAPGGPVTGTAGGNPGAWVGLWNDYNRVVVAALAIDSASSWTYASATWRPADNSANNRITAVTGVAEDSVTARYQALASSAGGAEIGVGVDITSFSNGTPGQTTSSVGTQALSSYVGQSLIGRHYYQALELSVTGTSTFYQYYMQLSAQLRY